MKAKPGSDYFLANYTQTTQWLQKIATESDRMKLVSIGKVPLAISYEPDVITGATDPAMNATARAVGLPPRLARHATTFLVRFAVRDHANCGHSHFSHAGQPARTIFSV